MQLAYGCGQVYVNDSETELCKVTASNVNNRFHVVS